MKRERFQKYGGRKLTGVKRITRQRLGLRQPSAALRRKAGGGKAAEGCRSPKPRGRIPTAFQIAAMVLWKPLQGGWEMIFQMAAESSAEFLPANRRKVNDSSGRHHSKLFLQPILVLGDSWFISLVSTSGTTLQPVQMLASSVSRLVLAVLVFRGIMPALWTTNHPIK